MDDLHSQTSTPDACLQLHLAGGTSGGHVPGLGGGEIVRFAFQYFERSLVVGDKLRTGQAAAPVRFGQLDEFEAIDHLQQDAWLLPDTLPAPQVTGIMVSNPDFYAPPGFLQRDGHQELTDIPDFFTEGRCPPGPNRITGQYFAVIL